VLKLKNSLEERDNLSKTKHAAKSQRGKRVTEEETVSVSQKNGLYKLERKKHSQSKNRKKEERICR